MSILIQHLLWLAWIGHQIWQYRSLLWIMAQHQSWDTSCTDSPHLPDTTLSSFRKLRMSKTYQQDLACNDDRLGQSCKSRRCWNETGTNPVCLNVFIPLQNQQRSDSSLDMILWVSTSTYHLKCGKVSSSVRGTVGDLCRKHLTKKEKQMRPKGLSFTQVLCRMNTRGDRTAVWPTHSCYQRSGWMPLCNYIT